MEDSTSTEKAFWQSNMVWLQYKVS